MTPTSPHSARTVLAQRRTGRTVTGLDSWAVSGIGVARICLLTVAPAV
jgi:hypothetical protein